MASIQRICRPPARARAWKLPFLSRAALDPGAGVNRVFQDMLDSEDIVVALADPARSCGAGGIGTGRVFVPGSAE
ncbi:hypothetical protein WBP07_20365 (plasmid) [Novosphingobium sp. BL-8A]|uniref:hypothetical protein n=1 Tax=Novosphingobium sp. BL-8A TaxID=3127639 RepID=UPI003757E82E